MIALNIFPTLMLLNLERKKLFKYLKTIKMETFLLINKLKVWLLMLLSIIIILLGKIGSKWNRQKKSSFKSN